MAEISLLFISLILIVSIIVFYYGKSKGVLEAYKRPDIFYPSVLDITVIGRYRIREQSTHEIVEKIEKLANTYGFTVLAFPNVIKVQRIIEPPEAKKKKNIFEKLELLRNGYPEELTLFLSKSTKKGFLEVEAKCLPVMYRKMAQGIQYAFPKSSVEDAQIFCKEFIESIMRVLDAEVLMKPCAESSIRPIVSYEFLYNTPSQDNINVKAHELIASSMKQILIAGWVDREFIGDLENAQNRGVNVKIITKSPEGSDRTIREDFKRLIKTFGKENVRLNPRFHDRFLICDNRCIIGSMYYTSSSKTRFESAIYTEDEKIVNALLSHFERIWNDKDSKIPK